MKSLRTKKGWTSYRQPSFMVLWFATESDIFFVLIYWCWFLSPYFLKWYFHASFPKSCWIPPESRSFTLGVFLYATEEKKTRPPGLIQHKHLFIHFLTIQNSAPSSLTFAFQSYCFIVLGCCWNLWSKQCN